eukprot:scaffold1155_cov217-Pinguiococcus_pyrenoidosus.AAC.3
MVTATLSSPSGNAIIALEFPEDDDQAFHPRQDKKELDMEASIFDRVVGRFRALLLAVNRHLDQPILHIRLLNLLEERQRKDRGTTGERGKERRKDQCRGGSAVSVHGR